MAADNEHMRQDAQTELREYFLKNVGQVVDSAEIHVVSGGIGDIARRFPNRARFFLGEGGSV